MIIILEGADLVGKTTITKCLSENLHIPRTGTWIDLIQPKPAVISVAKATKMILDVLCPDIIFDRSFMSEWVYGRLLGREYEYIDELILEWGQIDNVFLAVLYASENVLRSRYNVRGDKYLGIEEILQANEIYKEFYDYVHQHIASCFFDVSSMNSADIVDCISRWIYSQ